MEAINLNNLNVDANGRASFSGLSSGIDIRGTVDAIIAARRIPVDRLEATVEENAEKITALEDLRVLLESMRTSLSRLFGQISFGNNNDIFSGKQAFASSGQVDGTAASAAGNLLGVTVDNDAAVGNHTIEILKTAKAHKISSDQITDPAAALGFVDGNEFTLTTDKFRTSFQSSIGASGGAQLTSSGTISFTDEDGTAIGTVSYLSTDTLDDLATAITNNVTGVTAIVENVSTGVRLSLSGAEGFRVAETGAGDLLTDWEIGVTKFSVNSTMSLLDLRDLINQANTGNNATGINASVVTVTASESYLVLTGANTGVNMTLADTSGTPLHTIGILEGANVVGNLLQFSDELDNAYWTLEQAILSANSAIAPDGTMTAEGLIPDTNNNIHMARTTVQESVTSGQDYIYSTYAKAGDREGTRIQINGGGFGGAHYAEFNLQNGTVGFVSPSVSATDIEDVGNGWYRVSMKVTATATAGAHFERYSRDTTGTTFAGDGTTVGTYFWGAQLEEVTVETSPAAYVSTSIKIKNELQAAQQAELYADGILDQSNLEYESDFQTSAAAQVGSAGTLSFNGGALGTVSYLATDSLTTLATNITASITGVSAEVVSDGTGVRLQITGTPAFTITESGGGTAIADLGIDNQRKVITRTSNTIDDLFAGVTLSVFAAEVGTTISLDIEQDLSQVKTEIFSFVEAYNATRQYVNGNRLFDAATGTLDEETGVLAKSQALSTVASQLSQIVGAGVLGVDPNYTVLSQIGVNFVDITQEDPLLAENLEIDETMLDSILLTNADDVKKLFNFNLTSGDPRITLLNFTGDTQYTDIGYTLNVQPNAGSNLMQYSEQADNAFWTTEQATISVNNGTVAAPDGTFTAEGLIPDTNNNIHMLRTTAQQPATSGQSYVYSTYAKAGDREGARLQINGGAFSGAHYAEFNLQTGTVGAVSPSVEATTIEDAGDGWYRISMKLTATADGSAHFERYTRDTTGTFFTGDGATIGTHFWGVQFEEVDAGTNTPGAYRATTDTTIVAGTPTANIDGAAGGFDDGSATVTGNVITVNTGNAQGLQLFFNGINDITSTQLDITVGLGAQMYFKLGELLDVTTGIVDGEIDELTDQNRLNNERITEMLDRLEIQRQNLLERYISMETAIASANRIMDSLKQTTDQLAAGNG